ncbi:MAG: LysM peptidoglycan-binding domain-containing protein [Chloroflexi bacterium]|nr:MAG: LysM peptidoglycan-binding domain-containing protein [Chloroflexota bacterium]
MQVKTFPLSSESMFKVTIIVAVVLGVAFGFLSNYAAAQDECVVTQPEGWVEYRIRPGETLFAIAGRNGTTFDVLARINCITNPRVILAGNSILIPGPGADPNPSVEAAAPAAQQSAVASGPQSFVVSAGAGLAPGNSEVLAFAPSNLQVHRGDTVTWLNNGFHNIRFSETGNIPLVLIPGQADVEIPQVNPAVALPSIQSGSVYTGGGANSGLPADGPPIFSLVIDLAPGTYNYVCDVHPGMNGTIEVVADDVPVPSQAEVMMQAGAEIGALAGPTFGIIEELEANNLLGVADENGVAHVQADASGAGRVSVQQFFPFTVEIEVGQTVEWSIPPDAADPHTVTWQPLRGQDIVPIPQDAGPPILGFGPGFTPNIPPNGEVGRGVNFNSALLFPGQTFSLTFTEPGAYPYVCNIHPAMQGTIVVLPASEEATG